MSEELDLALAVLDRQLLDREGRRCGKVDDLELEQGSDGSLRAVAILAGPGAWAGRGALGRLAARLAGGRVVHVPWAVVRAVDSAVRLALKADELGLGRGDDAAARIVDRLPGADL